MKKILLILTFFLISLLIIVTYADVNAGTHSNFGYANGTYFIHPGVYLNVCRIDNVWYFDGNQYPTPSAATSPLIYVGLSVAVLALVLVISEFKRKK